MTRSEIEHKCDWVFGTHELAEELGVSPMTARKLAVSKAQGIPVRFVGGGVMASRSELSEWRSGICGHLSDRLVGRNEIAAVVGVSIPTLVGFLRDSSLGFPAKMVGGRWWASRSAVIQWCQRQTGSKV